MQKGGREDYPPFSLGLSNPISSLEMCDSKHHMLIAKHNKSMASLSFLHKSTLYLLIWEYYNLGHTTNHKVAICATY